LAGAIAGLILLGLMVGTVLAWINRPEPLLPATLAGGPKVPRLDSVQAQYFYAQMAAHDREAAWRAIAEFFPLEKSAENLRYARLAMKGLGEYYFSNEQWADALTQYGQLERVERRRRNCTWRASPVWRSSIIVFSF